MLARITFALALIMSAAFAPPAGAANAAEYRQRFGAFVDTLRADPNAPPGFVIVVTSGSRTLFAHAYGVRDVETGAPLTLDTPILSASVTKSHVALLAAILDERGVLPLDASLLDVWPELTLPTGLDPGAVTVTRLLSHQSGIDDVWLDRRSIMAGNVTRAEVPGHLARYATATPPGFQYSNLGPYLYSMMLEQRTGRDWRDVLGDEVLAPLRLRRTTIRRTDIADSEIARCHQRIAGRWRALPLENPAALNAAGGLHTSGRDAARFVQAFATSGRSAHGAVSARALERTWRREVGQEGDLWGLARDGYGLGWDLSAYDGDRIVSRSGGYPGCRSAIAFSPALGVSVTAFAVADAGANALLFTLIKQAFDFAAERPDAAQRAQARIEEYRQIAADRITTADAISYPDLAAPAEHPEQLAAFPGTYSADVFGDMNLRATPNGLVGEWGALRVWLLPSEGDTFHGYVQGDPETMTFAFERDSAGRVATLHWEGLVLQRQ